ncbi:Fis family transcriptional regulator [Halorhodospira abdelmalekii]|uniref:DNA-binding transcriptional regulator Fis n=1 Tax=Halorhodospira abdelmalekii TaxID=421629 RepID=UPI0019050589|nr:DNA-binding transcriptional regulator Fis [Halorhodospira abdelmalekii]MBK1734323.1 Fis family transcriptional regulator [Halorhodospira abdelmalekii]
MDKAEGAEPQCGSPRGETGVEGGPIRAAVTQALDDYFRELAGHDCHGLYHLVLREVEAPLLQAVMLRTNGNQTKAAQLLGLNRATLRKKLREHGLAS